MSYAKHVCAFFAKTTKGRIWLCGLLAYGVVGPIVVRIALPDGTEPSFWTDFFRAAFGGGNAVLFVTLVVVFLVNPLTERWRERRAAKGAVEDD